MGAIGQQSGQPCQGRTAFDGQLHCDVVPATQTHDMGSSEGKPADSQFCRLSADIASTSGLSTGAALPLSLADVSLFTDEPVSPCPLPAFCTWNVCRESGLFLR